MEANLISSLSQSVDAFQKITGFVVAVGTFASVWISTRSTQALRDRMHDKAGTKRKFNDARLQKQAELEDDLHSFNIRYRLGIQTTSAMFDIHLWAQMYDINLHDARKARPHFRPNTLEPHLPANGHPGRRKAAIFGVLIVVVIGLSATVNPFALITINKTQTRMWATNEAAYSALSFLSADDSWKLDRHLCLLVKSKYPLPDLWDKQVACSLISGRHDDYIGSAVTAQRFGGLCMIVMAFTVGLGYWEDRRRVRFARYLRARLDAALA